MKQTDILFWLIVAGLLLAAIFYFVVGPADGMPCADECAFIVKPTATSQPAYIAPTATETTSAYPAPATSTEQSGYPDPQPEPTDEPQPDATRPPTATPPDPSLDYVAPTATAPN